MFHNCICAKINKLFLFTTCITYRDQYALAAARGNTIFSDGLKLFTLYIWLQKGWGCSSAENIDFSAVYGAV